MALATFLTIDEHYLYTAEKDETDDDDVTPEEVQDSLDESEDGGDSGDEGSTGPNDVADNLEPCLFNIL